ncbi:hypothetical protein J6590_004638 [Homalodisca vitripennis]|nr:hypothetical protein J6590_004638 [Homalodisca vitripennis]
MSDSKYTELPKRLTQECEHVANYLDKGPIIDRTVRSASGLLSADKPLMREKKKRRLPKSLVSADNQGRIAPGFMSAALYGSM